MAQNLESRNRTIHTWSTDFLLNVSRQISNESVVFLTSGAGTINYTFYIKIQNVTTSYDALKN